MVITAAGLVLVELGAAVVVGGTVVAGGAGMSEAGAEPEEDGVGMRLGALDGVCVG